ncbi:hypothetical protein ANO14919_001220 [Xylariales sp. No.14919]|nr:hypothetical protein ANO14919_001220 [Xylariales sp. No.14919]
MASAAAQPESVGEATLAVSGFVIALAVISVGLRFYARVYTRQGLRADDWLILAAVVTTIVNSALLLWGNSVAPKGLWASQNSDAGYILTDGDVMYFKIIVACSVLYFTVSGTTKSGILYMYYRIFHADAACRYQVFALAGLVVGWWIGGTIAILTSCIPLEGVWTKGLADSTYCFNLNIFWLVIGIIETVLDMLILTLPLQGLAKLELTPRRKLTLSAIFLLGGFVVVTGIIKVVTGYVPGGRLPSFSNGEVWVTLHMGIAIVCSCLPLFKPLFDRLMESSLVIKMSTLFRKG